MGKPLPSLDELDRLTIVKPSSLGDIVHALPAVRALVSCRPELQVTWLVNSEWMPLLKGSDLIDELVEFPRSAFRGLAGGARYCRWIGSWRKRGGERECVIDLQGLLRSGVTSRLRGASIVVGTSDAREGAPLFHHRSIPVRANDHAVDRYLEVARAFGWNSGEVVFPLAAGRAPRDWIAGERPVVIHPYARGQGKKIELGVVKKLVEQLDHPVILVGRASGEPSMDWPSHVRDWTNATDLDELIWILREAGCVISADSGPMHMAAGVNPRTLAVHTWSDPRKVGPYPQEAWAWKRGQIGRWRDFDAETCQHESRLEEAALGAVVEWIERRIESLS